MTHIIPTRRGLIAGGTALAAMSLPRMSHAAADPVFQEPLIIGHRGAPGYMPEHTIGSYETAIRLGADFIEPDVVATKDGHLVVRHDPVLGDSTDVSAHPEFASRKRTVQFKGFAITDWFVADFTLAEIKTLRARQVMPQRDHSHDGQYEVLTLQEMIDVVQAGARRTGRTLGIYPEVKFSSYHASIGLPIEDKLLDILTKAGLNRATAPVYIQSFETANLKALKKKTNIKLMQLVDATDTDPVTGAMTFAPPDDRPYDWVLAGRSGTYADLLTPAGLDDIATYAHVVAPYKRYLLAFATAPDGTRHKVIHPEIVANAHARGLKVHIWTMRNDASYLDPSYNGDPIAEYLDFFRMGVDGLFSDFADTAVEARRRFLAAKA
jgi:glycerophosphoryl diester phosphodiesterase